MAKAVAPPKSTGGGAFVFADKVCAWFIAHMPANEHPLGPGKGHIASLHFESRPDGWHLDDLVMTLSSGSEEHHVALSIKSNTQFSEDAAPPDFVRMAWEQFLGESSSPFDAAADFMGLITAPLPSKTRTALDFVIQKAREIDAARLPNRFRQKGWANEEKRALFKSFASPADLAKKHGMRQADIGRLLRRIIHLQFDFEAVVSEREKEAVERCRKALRSGETGEAERLWEHLLHLSADKRQHAGDLDRQSLLDNLRSRFDLADLPNHAPDWKRLQTHASTSMEQVRDTIGSVHLDRGTEIDRLRGELGKHPGAVLIGSSGVGKSAIAKEYADGIVSSGRKCLWFDAISFERQDFAAFESDLRLNHTLSEILGAIPDPGALLVLDGLDRLYDSQAFSLVGTLIRFLGLERDGCPWRILLTCQTQEWDRLCRFLVQAGIPATRWPVVNCEPPSDEVMEPIWKEFPNISRLKSQPKIRSILRNLKILDLMITYISTGGNVEPSAWVGESSVACWYWENQIATGKTPTIRERFVMRFAERLADETQQAASLDSFDNSGSAPLDGLIADRVCVRTREGKVAFAHDLIGDWARLRVIIAHADDLLQFLSARLESPLWHRAFRLYGTYLLEHERDFAQWRSLLLELGQVGHGVARDLLVESIIFATEPREILDLAAEDLLCDGGVLLRRLLGRFLAFATVPDPRVSALAKQMGIDESAAAIAVRIPIWRHWHPVISFLHKYQDRALEAAPVEIGRISELWLSLTPVGSPLRREVAELGLELGCRARLSRQDYRSIYCDHRNLFYKVALWGAHELPDEVAEFALMASERPLEADKPPETPPTPRNLSNTMALGPWRRPKGPPPAPWPDGPRMRVDDEFQKAALDSQALLPLEHVCPTVAREVILATIIESPKSHLLDYDLLEMMNLNLDYGMNWQPPLHTHGPFLAFLRINFAQGLETIARLVDFAAERSYSIAENKAWTHSAEMTPLASKPTRSCIEATHPKAPRDSVVLPLEQEEHVLLGDAHLYGWSAGLGNPPSPVQCALMALEQYFYMEMDEQRPIHEKIQNVLLRAKSVAFLKPLCEVGKRDVELFAGPLRPLLAIPEIYFWEIQTQASGRHSLLMVASLFADKFVLGMAKDFHEMKHRYLDLRDIVVRLIHQDENIREFMSLVLQRWNTRLLSTSNDAYQDFIQNLIVRFDRKNHELIDHPDYGTLIRNTRLEEMHAQCSEERRASNERLVLFGLTAQCRKMIDDARIPGREELEDLWSQAYGLGQASCEDHSTDPPAQNNPTQEPNSLDEAHLRANAIAGAVAVFIRLCPDWLSNHPDRKEWCRNQLERIIQNPPSQTPTDSPRSVSTFTWDCFAAEAVPVLWAADPADPKMRQWVAGLVCSFHYVAVRILLRRCAESRQVLANDFEKLRRLLFECAYARRRLAHLRWACEYLNTDKNDSILDLAADIDAWMEERISAFVNGTIPPPTDNWPDMDQPKRFRKLDNLGQRGPNRYTLDFELVYAAHAWIPVPAMALNQEERRSWMSFRRSALNFTLSQFEGSKQYATDFLNGEYGGVLHAIAIALPHMTPEERPEDFWQPILSLSENAHHQVESFLRDFHRAALQKDPVLPSFIPLRDAMAEFAFAKTTDDPENPAWLSFQDVWAALIGIDSWTRDCWQPRHRSIVEQSRSVFERWFFLCGDRHLSAFSCFLKLDAADPIRLQGLVWLSALLTGPEAENTILANRGVDDSVSSLLTFVWKNSEAPLKRNEAAFSAFRALLHWLVDIQNPHGLELSRVIGGL